MSDGALTVLDGTHLRAVHVTLPESYVALTGAQVLDLADSTASSSLFGFSLPQTLKSSALQSLNIQNDDAFRRTELAPEQASQTVKLYIAAIADELKGIMRKSQVIYLQLCLTSFWADRRVIPKFWLKMNDRFDFVGIVIKCVWNLLRFGSYVYFDEKRSRQL